MGNDFWADRDLTEPQPGNEYAAITRELAPGERVVWQGRPRWDRFLWISLFFVPFGIAFGGIPLFIQQKVMQEFGGNPLSQVVTLPFVLVGGALVLGPFWAVWRAARTRYAITNRRIIMTEPSFPAGIETRSYAADALKTLVRTERGNGSGDLIFEEIRNRDSDGHTHVIRRGFLGVEQVRAVETTLRATLLADSTGP